MANTNPPDGGGSGARNTSDAETTSVRHRVTLPPKEGLLKEFKSVIQETFFHDAPLRDFKDQTASKKALLGIQAVFPIIGWAREYNLKKLRGDVISGLTIASLCIPQDIGYAKLANVDPKYGLYSSFVPPLVYAGMGSSRDIAIGPVAVVSLLLGTLCQAVIDPVDNPTEYLRLVFTATFFAGIFEAGLGFLRLGFLIDFLSHAAVVGFMGGAAITIALQQLKGFLGIKKFTKNTDIVSVMQSVFGAARHGWNWQTILIGASFLTFLIVAKFIGKRNKKLFWVPAIAPLISVIISTFFVFITRADKQGVQIVKHIDQGINPISAHKIYFSGKYLTEGIRIGGIAGMVALTEAVAIARTFAAMKDYQIDGNKEMIALGTMNVVGSLTSCYIATGSFSRSAVNYMAGVHTAVSNIVMAIVVALTLEFITPLFKYTPNAILAAIIISAVLGLIDIDAAVLIWKIDKLDFMACMGAFFGVVFVSVEIGLLISVVISFAKILLQVTRPRTAILGKLPGTTVYRNTLQYPKATKIPGIMIIRVDSAIYFSNSNYVRERTLRWLREEEEKAKAADMPEIKFVILEMSPVTDIDTSGIHSIEELHKSLEKKHIQWYLSENLWYFVYDPTRAARVLCVTAGLSYADFLVMVCEEYRLESDPRWRIKLSYKVARKTHLDIPPVAVCNQRQFEMFIRQCKAKGRSKLCVEIEEIEAMKPKIVAEESPNKRQCKAKGKRKLCVEIEEIEAIKPKIDAEQSPNKRQKKDDEYYKMKAAGKKPVTSETTMDEANGDDVYGEDDEEIDRFDCCDDSDGDSSGDEDYYRSDYMDKDEEGEKEITDDEEEVKEKAKDEMWSKKETKSSSPVKKNTCWSQRTEFLPGAIIGSNDIAVGQKYDSKAAIARRLKILSVIQKFDFKVIKSYPDLYVVNCRVEGCKWRVRAAVVKTSPLFQIRKYQSHHTCSVTERSKTSRKATPEILGSLLREFVGSAGAGFLPKHVEVSLRLYFGIIVDYWKSHRTLKAARILDRGTPEQGYEDLPSYLYRIKSSNPGTYSRLEVDELDRFKYVFIAFGASTAGFWYMRKVIVVDGTFLKGKYLGTLLLATTQDGNYNIFPLAFSVVDTENDASWEWFFCQLSHVIPDNEAISIISDRHKSIGKAIGKVYPRAHRGICTYHLYKNILLRYGGKETFGYVKKTATAYSVPEFDHYYGRIKDANPQLHKYLEGADVAKWSRVHFKGDRYNFTTTNIAESINKVLKPARLYPIAKLLDEIRLMLTRWFAARRKQAAIMTTFLTTGVEKKLEGRVGAAKVLDIQEIDQHLYEVRSASSVHVVNLSLQTCTCGMFDAHKIPCVHALAAADTTKVSSVLQCHPYYRTDSLRKGYSELIMPKDSACELPDSVISTVCNPPLAKTQSGRPKLSRFKGKMETGPVRTKPRKPHVCSVCNHTGHNSQTCNVLV